MAMQSRALKDINSLSGEEKEIEKCNSEKIAMESYKDEEKEGKKKGDLTEVESQERMEHAQQDDDDTTQATQHSSEKHSKEKKIYHEKGNQEQEKGKEMVMTQAQGTEARWDLKMKNVNSAEECKQQEKTARQTERKQIEDPKKKLEEKQWESKLKNVSAKGCKQQDISIKQDEEYVGKKEETQRESKLKNVKCLAEQAKRTQSSYYETNAETQWELKLKNVNWWTTSSAKECKKREKPTRQAEKTQTGDHANIMAKAQKERYLELKQMIEFQKPLQWFEKEGPKILKLLQANEIRFPQEEESLLAKLIHKSSDWLESAYFVPVAEAMARVSLESGIKDTPLKLLASLIHGNDIKLTLEERKRIEMLLIFPKSEDGRRYNVGLSSKPIILDPPETDTDHKLLASVIDGVKSMLKFDEEKILSLIEVLIPFDESEDDRITLLEIMLLHTSEWLLGDRVPCSLQSSLNVSCFTWNEKFVLILKKLAQKGADPGVTEMDATYGSALHMLFMIMQWALHESWQLCFHLEELCALLMSEKSMDCSNITAEGDTVLHTLLRNFGNSVLRIGWAPKHYFEIFRMRYKGILLMVILKNPRLLQACDKYGVGPLEAFIDENVLFDHIKGPGNVFQMRIGGPGKAYQWHIASDIVTFLKSVGGGSYQENQERLMYKLAYRLIRYGIEDELRDGYIKLAQSLRTEQSINFQSDLGTPLHWIFNFVQYDEIFNQETFIKLVSRNPFLVEREDHVFSDEIDLKTWPNDQERFLQLLKCFTSSVNRDMQTGGGATPLHGLAAHAAAFAKNGYDMKQLVKFLASPRNVDIQDVQGSTALHRLLQEMIYGPVSFGKVVLEYVSEFVSKDNVNAVDEYGRTPYSWILWGKERSWEHYISDEDKNQLGRLFERVEELLLDYSPNADLAYKGTRFIAHEYIARLLHHVDFTCTDLTKLHVRCEDLKKRADPESLKSKTLCNGLKGFCGRCVLHGRENYSVFILGKKVVATLLNDFSAQSCFDDAFLESLNPSITTKKERLFQNELLNLYLKTGARPTKCNIEDYLANLWHLAGCRSVDERELPTLILLLRSYREQGHNDVINCDLTLYLDHYAVTEEMCHLGSQAVCYAYMTLENCLASESIINTFLFMKTEMKLEYCSDQIEKWFQQMEKVHTSSWLKRSILHLAVIFLDNKEMLQCIPSEIISKYIDATDLHGCTPLHVAHLHHNEEAVQFLKSQGAQDVKDNFGATAESLGSRVGVVEKDGKLETKYYGAKVMNSDGTAKDHIDVLYQKLCCSIMETDGNVLEKIRPMLVLSQQDAEEQSSELKELFERIMTHIGEPCEVAIGGSLREKLKVGRFDEVDVQLRFFKRRVELFNPDPSNYSSTGWLSAFLKGRLGEISWEGLHLRLISTCYAWEFIWEKPGSFGGLTISVDVVPIFISSEEQSNCITDIYRSILRDPLVPIHNFVGFMKLDHNILDLVKETVYQNEWVIIDRLPTECRLGIVIAKALLQAYYWSKGGRYASFIDMPITSYHIKLVVFKLLFKDPEVPVSGKSVSIQEILRNTEGTNESDDDYLINRTDLWQTELNRSPVNSRWTSEKDLEKYAEDGRPWAIAIFRCLLLFAKNDFNEAISFWGTSILGEKSISSETIAAICKVLLKFLDKENFY